MRSFDECRRMTAFEQLAAWAADADTGIFCGTIVGEQPPIISRLVGNEVGRCVEKIIQNAANVAHLQTVAGIAFVTIDGRFPAEPRVPYRLVLAAGSAFGSSLDG